MSDLKMDLNGETIAKLLSEKRQALDVIIYESIDSTNSEAKRQIYAERSTPFLLLAKTQTGGRGRLGRSFYSPAESGLYMTLSYPTKEPLLKAVHITSASAVAVMRAIKTQTGKQTGIKWVNDLYYKEKKVCGILAEAMQDPRDPTINHVIVGIGVNVHPATFPPELEGIAGSLEADCNPCLLVADIVSNLLLFAFSPENRDYMNDYRDYSIVLGKKIKCTRGNETYIGIADHIDDNGMLYVRMPDRSIRILDSGEVSLRLI